MLQHLLKPWYVYRPSQIPRRVTAELFPPPGGYRQLATSWGCKVWADPTKTIGQNILVSGLYDLAVSELLARLIHPGDTILDVGANVGYMTVLAAMAAGERGRVISCEPHPELFGILQRNADDNRASRSLARIEAHHAAVGARTGTAHLNVPSTFATNDGVSRIVDRDSSKGKTIAVEMTRIDDLLGTDAAAVLKIDVEGFEAEVLRGGRRALESHRIKHVVFEEHDIKGSEVVPMLQGFGYSLLSVGWSMHGLTLGEVEAGSLAKGLEAPNYIATVAPADVRAWCRPRGWMALRRFARN